MNDELTIMRWGEKDVRVGGENKVNLVDVAKCCGLTKIANSGNVVIRWKGSETSVVSKLKTVVKNLPREFQEEVQKILIEIDETDDRNSIYISNWLAQRIATECKSQTAMEFKNWLVTLNCAREEIEKQNKVSMQDLLNVQQQIGELAHLMDKTVNSVVTIVKEQTELINKQSDTVDRQTELLEKQREEHEKDREELKQFIGLKCSDKQTLSNIIMTRCRKVYGENFKATDKRFKTNRDYFLGLMGVSKYEDIPVTNFSKAVELAKTFDIIILKKSENKKVEVLNDGKSKIKKGDTTIIIEGIKYKKCSCCGEYKELNEDNFYIKKQNKDGFDGKCKQCKSNYYACNRQKRLKYQNDYAHKNGIAINYKDSGYSNTKYSNTKK